MKISHLELKALTYALTWPQPGPQLKHRDISDLVFQLINTILLKNRMRLQKRKVNTHSHVVIFQNPEDH